MKLQDDFKVIYADTKEDVIKLENAIKSGNASELLGNKQYGIIEWERDPDKNTDFSLVTAEFFRDIHNKKEFPPTVLITISSKEDSNKNDASFKLDTHLIKADTVGAIVITDDGQVKGIISLADLSPAKYVDSTEDLEYAVEYAVDSQIQKTCRKGHTHYYHHLPAICKHPECFVILT